MPEDGSNPDDGNFWAMTKHQFVSVNFCNGCFMTGLFFLFWYVGLQYAKEIRSDPSKHEEK